MRIKGSYHMREKLLIGPRNWGRGELGRTGPSIKENKNTKLMGAKHKSSTVWLWPSSPMWHLLHDAVLLLAGTQVCTGLSPVMPSAGSGMIAWCALQERCSDPGGLVPTETHHTPTRKSVLVCCSPTCIAQYGSLWPRAAVNT